MVMNSVIDLKVMTLIWWVWGSGLTNASPKSEFFDRKWWCRREIWRNGMKSRNGEGKEESREEGRCSINVTFVVSGQNRKQVFESYPNKDSDWNCKWEELSLHKNISWKRDMAITSIQQNCTNKVTVFTSFFSFHRRWLWS